MLPTQSAHRYTRVFGTQRAAQRRSGTLFVPDNNRASIARRSWISALFVQGFRTDIGQQ